jgi:hypothetical protein
MIKQKVVFVTKSPHMDDVINSYIEDQYILKQIVVMDNGVLVVFEFRDIKPFETQRDSNVIDGNIPSKWRY